MSKIDSVFHWYVTSSVNNLRQPLSTWKIGYNPHGCAYNKYNYSYKKTTGITSSKYIKELFIDLSHFRFKRKQQLFLCNSNHYIDQSIKLPDYKCETIRCDNPYESNILNGIISNSVIDMINSGDINAAAQHLNCTLAKEDNLINIVCKKYYTKLDNLNILYEAKEKITYSSVEQKQNTLKNIKSKIEDIKHKINLIHTRIKDGNNCPICFDSPSNKTIVNCCNNPFCLECITNYLNYKKNGMSFMSFYKN